MSKELIALAKAYVASHSDALLDDAIACCLSCDHEDEQTFACYEQFLADEAQNKSNMAAAAAYLLLAMTEKVVYEWKQCHFDVDQGIRLMLHTDAYDAYCDLVDEVHPDTVVGDEVHDQLKKIPLRNALKLAYSAEEEGK